MPRAPGRQLHPRIVNERSFIFWLGLEIEKARRLRYCTSVLSMSPDGFDRQATGSLQRIAALAADATRATDLLVVRPPDSVAMMIIDGDLSSLATILKRVSLAVQTLFQGNGEGRPEVTWSAGGACFPTAVAEAQRIFNQAVDLMTAARRDGGNRLYLPI